MAERSFNYSTQAFQQHAAHPGFWHYTSRIAAHDYRFGIRFDEADLRLPRAA